MLEGTKFTASSTTEAAFFCTLNLSSCTGDHVKEALANMILFPSTHSLITAKKGLKITRRVLCNHMTQLQFK